MSFSENNKTTELQQRPAADTENKNTPEKIATALKSQKTTDQGLSSSEATSRLAVYGPNRLEVKEKSRWRKFLGHFNGPISWMIEVAALVSLIRQDWIDFIVIFALLIYNVGIETVQDIKAGNALTALKNSLALKAQVLRDGKWCSIPSAEVVPGDILTVRAGDVIPADIILISGEYLSVDQAALTGESLPVTKKPGDQAYSGSIAKQGAVSGVVTATGGSTFFGKTAKLVAAAGAKSHTEKAVAQIGDFLLIAALILAVFLIGGMVWHYRAVHGYWSWSDTGVIVEFILVLLVASVPIALPSVMSMTMALGAIRLARLKAIVSRLSAIEELAGADILCSDKTGTLTQNLLTLQAPVLFEAKSKEEILAAALRATQANSPDAIDRAVLAAAEKSEKNERASYQTVRFIPFDPVSKKTLSIVTEANGQIVHCAKGAPQAVLALCRVSAEEAARYQAEVKKLAGKGIRALGVARSDDNGQNFSLLGLLALSDPPRSDAVGTVLKAKKLGLSVKMVTGDDVAIGNEISEELGLGHNLQSARQIFAHVKEAKDITAENSLTVEQADGFAGVFLEHKYDIVVALQKRDHVVAMTGDGVNDAPALKQADCGVAVSGATDAARNAAALILTSPGLSTVINAVIESRSIFRRISSYIYYRIAMTVDFMLVVVATYFIFHYPAVTAIMIVMLAMLNDIPIMTLAYDRVEPSAKPVRWNMRHTWLYSSAMGLLAWIQSFLLVGLGVLWMHSPKLTAFIPITHPVLMTALFLQLSVGGHFLLLVVRSDKAFFRRPRPDWRLGTAIGVTKIIAGLMCFFGFLVPALPWQLILIVFGYCLVWLGLIGALNILLKRLLKKSETPFINKRKHQPLPRPLPDHEANSAALNGLTGTVNRETIAAR